MSQWIDVNERMPQADQMVLIAGTGGDISVRRFREARDDEWKRFVDPATGRFVGVSRITHWMPLPEPPEDAK